MFRKPTELYRHVAANEADMVRYKSAPKIGAAMIRK